MKRITLAVLTVMFALMFTPGLVAQPKPTTKGVQEVATPQPTNEFNVSVRNNRLAFETIEDYERVVNNPTEELKAAFLKIVDKFGDFTSFTEAYDERPLSRVQSLIDDEYFAAILNSDLVVQIGENIFRVNPAAERVYVLPVINEDQYDDLVSENIENTNIQVFSTDDNVLEMIQNVERRRWFCRESGIATRASLQFLSDNSRRVATAAFKTFGIYFSLFAEINDQRTSEIIYDFEFTGGIGAGKVNYRIRCGSTADYETKSPGSWVSGILTRRFQSYQGSTNLNLLYFGFRVKRRSTGNYVSNYVIIREN